ncbi:MAG: 2'-5' RNA ligase family protein [Agathobacter sp.]|uniref:2'-5' RNA ligase family protein n=1 Tax=Agathobacter sp. TaxID=2021311 RepID=UPI00258010A0|nr:2'-5' RNA ligase family protein [Agathobacter sp.]MBQ1681155.1 2'-5' RNA ligase family protein [Agathobacter sp.]
MYLLTAYFDDSTTEQLQRLMNEVARQTGNDFMPRNHVPPHMTISAFDQKNPQRAVELFERFSSKLSEKNLNSDSNSNHIYIASPGAFLPSVIYLEAVQNRYLFELSEMAHKEFCADPATRPNRFYLPFQWIPHITIAKQLTDEQMRIAFAVLQQSFHPLEAKIVRFGLSKPNPHTDLAERRIHGNSCNIYGAASTNDYSGNR